MSRDTESPRYFAVHWRNVPETTEAELEDFLAWLEYDQDSPDISDGQMKDIKALVNAYLGRNMSQVKKGERAMLDQWTKAVNHEAE